MKTTLSNTPNGEIRGVADMGNGLKAVPSIIFTVITIVLLTTTLSQHWWHYSEEQTYQEPWDVRCTFETKYGLKSAEMSWESEQNINIPECKTTKRNTTSIEYNQTMVEKVDMVRVINTTYLLLITVLTLWWLTIACIILSLKFGIKTIVIILSISALVATIALPMYFCTALPPTFTEQNGKGAVVFYPGGIGKDKVNGFFGHEDISIPEFNGKIKVEWGPCQGWYLSLIAVLFGVLAFISVLQYKPLKKERVRSRKKELEVGQVTNVKTVRCRVCGKMIKVEMKLPVRIKCPKCGNRGVVK